MSESPAPPLTLQDLTAALKIFKEELKSDFATKEDLKLFATKDDFQSLRGEFGEMKEYLKSFEARVGAQFRAVHVQLASVSGDVHDIKRELREDVAKKTDLDRICRFADRCLSEIDESRELRTSRGARLDEVAESVDDLKKRVRALEDRRES